MPIPRAIAVETLEIRVRQKVNTMRSAVTNGRTKGGLSISGIGARFGSTKLAAATFRGALTLAVLSALLFIAARPVQAQTETVLHNFTGGSDGANPGFSLISDHAGNLYGTTSFGGAFGAGTVFKLSPNGGGSWKETVLYSFTGGVDGANPYGPVLFDSVGNLYGTTENGGAAGGGTVFKLTHSGTGWTEAVLYSFSCQFGCNGGVLPVNRLIMDPAGNLYGTTNPGYVGVVFELSPSGGGWTEQTIFPDGATTGLTTDAGGNIFFGRGNLIYELSPNGSGGWNSTLIFNFANMDHEFYWTVKGTPVLDQAGNLYGTTFYGGTKGSGSVYKLSHGKTRWTAKILYSFKNDQDGGYPVAGVVLDAAGNLYGATSGGGKYNGGTVFELVPPVGVGSYQEKVLWNFTYKDGYVPSDSLILDSAGNLYGTTPYGGPIGYGVAFELTP